MKIHTKLVPFTKIPPTRAEPVQSSLLFDERAPLAHFDVRPVPVADRREVWQRVVVEADEDDVQDDSHLGGKSIDFFRPEKMARKVARNAARK